MDNDMEELLQRAGLSPEVAGERLGKASQTVRNWIAGRTIPKLEPDEYVALLRVFGCTPEELAKAIELTRAKPARRKKPGRKKSIEEEVVGND